MTNSECKIDSNGAKRWRNKEGKLHRLDGPAFEWTSDFKQWWVNGKRHRLDGPAVEYASDLKKWWVNDKNLLKEEFDQHPLVVFHRLCKEAL
jgi:hypothetical protein